MINLPIDEQIPNILKLLTESSSLVLSASPGAGKTTRLPPALLQITNKQVWVLEPRRMAAVAASYRIAEEQRWKVGQEVGFQVRFEDQTSSKTRLIFLTEALLARKILQDPELKDVGIVVLDEFHERSIHIDIALGLLKELQILSRPDLKIVVMSATLNAKPLSDFLETAPVVEVPGKLFELQIIKSKQSLSLRTDYQFIERVCDSIKSQILSRPKGRDILVFLPGMSEISRVQRALETWVNERDLLLLSLSGTLGLQDQLRALKPAAQRKIILSTNVAESSVTIDGVDTVIDSGLSRILRKHPKTDFEQLVISRISKASAKQRAGRAARQWPGQCLQLWTTQDELSMPEFELAEIHRTDLTEIVLFLKKWGAQELSSFSWYEKPNSEALQRSETWLEKVGALSGGIITAHGKKLAGIPVHPRIAQILMVADSLGAGALGCNICALLQERDIKTSGHHHMESDLLERAEWLESYQNGHAPRDLIRSLETISKSSEQLKRWVSTNRKTELSVELIGEILLLASPDRLCHRRAPGRRQALMVGGRGVELAENSCVKDAEFFIALDVMELESSKDTQIRRATAVSRSLIDKHFSSQFLKVTELNFDERTNNFYIEEFNSLWGVPLEEPRRRLAKADEVAEHLPDVFVKKWDTLLLENENLAVWWDRWLFYEQQRSVESPLWSDEKKNEAFKMACLGENKWSSVVEKDLVYFFESQIDSKALQDFHRKCPSQIEVPTGNQIRLHYHLDKNPHLEVRLQELFGMTQTPTVWEGKILVTLHLLGPNYRPVQMTSDLASFWKNTYSDVKKELKSHYPKHSWPEDPLTAPAVARGRPRSK